ncbi:MAG: hypothetical protein ACRD3I_13685 [Terriglobales bacterium]
MSAARQIALFPEARSSSMAMASPRACPRCHVHRNDCACPFPRLRHSGFCACGFQFLRCQCANALTVQAPCPGCREPRAFMTCGHITAHQRQESQP